VAVILYSAEELDAFLMRSVLPSLITEGSDDYSLMRNFAAKIGGDCLPVGGKQNVLQAAQRDAVAPRSRTAFVVDRDLWLLQGVPNWIEERPVVITDGYSIENDVLRDANAEALLDHDELPKYQDDIEQVCRWFASGATARLLGLDFDFERKINRVLVPGTSDLTEEAQQEIVQTPPDAAVLRTIVEDYPRFLRGKTWLRVLSRHVCAQDRHVQHAPVTILTMGMRSGREHSTQLISDVENFLEA
jgi:hypothetical protein